MSNIIFWLAGPPICCKGVFDAVADLWDGKVYYVCTKKIDADRSKIVSENYNISNNKINYVFINGDDAVANAFLEEHKEDIHIFNGYLGSSSVYMNKLMKNHKNAKIYIWAERTAYKNFKIHNKFAVKITNLLLNVKHCYYAFKYRNKVLGFFPLGKKGVQAYLKLGWKPENTFSFLYLPEMNEGIGMSDISSVPDKVKFVYLGRFSSGSKGTDILINALKKVKKSNYSLTMVGGYGNYKDETMSYIESNPNLQFGGTWPISEACDRLSEFDVCIVPSRSEGWNPTVNEALMAGIGCITTTEAVSDELVTAAKAGIVVTPDSASLASALDQVMEEPEMVLKWKRNAYNYKQNMTADICARYFIDCIDYTLGTIDKKPCPPWENN